MSRMKPDIGEPITPRKLAGMLLGFVGVVISMHARAGTQTARPQDVLLALAGVAAGVAATVIFKRMKDAPHPVMVNAVQLASAGVLLAPAALLIEGAPRVSFPPPVMVSLVWLVVVMSIGASLLWFWLLSHGDASRVSAFSMFSSSFGRRFFGQPFARPRITVSATAGSASASFASTAPTESTGPPRA